MENFPESAQSQLNQFKEYAISHPQLAQVDMLLMGAIREPAGFAHVLVYGPSGVGKTTTDGDDFDFGSWWDCGFIAGGKVYCCTCFYCYC